METQMIVTKKRNPPTRAKLARPIQSERDYHEAKALLARTMRAARSTEAARRAEALLREIVDYEIRVDSQNADEWSEIDADLDTHEGPRRRWNDPAE
ncbi:MAG: hypothetical protein KIT73_00570 [Burkholderiales bacterium]|nr:hypothetical protein [Burkholderiales bacterium]